MYVLGETATGFNPDHSFHIGNGQHICMFLFFGLGGVVDVLLFYGVPLPPQSDYAVSILAFIMETLLFVHHLHGRTAMNVQVGRNTDYMLEIL